MQNKTLLYGLGAVALVVVAGAAMFMNGSFGGQSAAVNNADYVPESTSMTELLASTDARTCKISTQAAGAATEGVLYVAGGNMRGDFTTTSNGQKIKSHMIVSNDISYLWTDSSNQGFYIPFAAMSGEAGAANGINASAKMDYACAPWVPTENTFALPTNITFQGI